MSTEIRLQKKFKIAELFREAWKITSNHLGKLILFLILFILVVTAAYLLIQTFLPVTDNSPWYTVLSNAFFQQVVNALAALGITNVFLKFSNYEPVKVADLFNKFKLLPTYFFSSLIGGLAVVLGLVLLIIPGIIVALRFSLFSYFIIDKNAGIFEALEESWDTVKGVTGKLLVFFLACILVNFLGLLCLGIGLFVTIPLTGIATALLYRTLWTQTNMTVLADETPTELPPS